MLDTDRAIVRSRTVRMSILRIVNVMFDGNPDVAISFDLVCQGLMTGMVPYSEEEIVAALSDLAERGLIEIVNLPTSGRMPEKGYHSTPRGRDFQAHRFPWDLVDAFGGRG